MVAFTSIDEECSDYQIAEGLAKKGWKLQVCQKPLCIHLAVTMGNIKKTNESFLKDIKDVLKEVRTIAKKSKILDQGKSRQLQQLQGQPDLWVYC